MNPAKPPVAPANDVAKLRQVPLGAVKANSDDDNDDHDLQQREDELKIACAFDADVIQRGDERSGDDGDELSVSDDERPADHGVAEKRERWKGAENAYQTEVSVAIDAGLAMANHVQA